MIKNRAAEKLSKKARKKIMERNTHCTGNDHLPKKGEERAWVSLQAKKMVEEVKP